MNIFTRLNDDDILRYMSPEECTAVLQTTETIVFHPGEVIMNAGDRNRDMFIIVKGKALVTLADEHIKMTFELGETDLIGEMNFILPMRRSATVIAATELSVLKYDYHKTMDFLANNITIAAKFFAALNDILAKKLVKTTQRKKNQVSDTGDDNEID